MFKLKQVQVKTKNRNIGDSIFTGVSKGIIFLFTLLCIYPFYYIIIYSISEPDLASQGIGLLPRGFSMETYKELFLDGSTWNAYGVSIARTVISTLENVLLTSLLAYLMTKQEMWGRKFVYRYFIVTMYMGAGLIPWYITMKTYGLQNNFWVYCIPGAFSVYNMILVKTFIEQLPASLEESAQIEGAGFFTIYRKIILPLSKPIIATITVYCAVGNWNAWRDNFFLVRNENLQTIQMVLHNFLNSAESLAKSMQAASQSANIAVGMDVMAAITPESIRMTSVVIATVPIMLVYPYAQKYFTKGIMMGAIKG